MQANGICRQHVEDHIRLDRRLQMAHGLQEVLPARAEKSQVGIFLLMSFCESEE